MSNHYNGNGTKTSENVLFLYYLTLTRILTWKKIYNTSNCKNFGFEQNLVWSIFMNFGFGCNLHFQLRFVLVVIKSILWRVFLYCFDFENWNFDKVIQITKDFTHSRRGKKIFRDANYFCPAKYTNIQSLRKLDLINWSIVLLVIPILNLAGLRRVARNSQWWGCFRDLGSRGGALSA